MGHTLVRKECLLFGIRVVKALASVVAIVPLLAEVSVGTNPAVMESLEFTAVPADGAPGVAPPCATVAPVLIKQEFREFLRALVLDFFLQAQRLVP